MADEGSVSSITVKALKDGKPISVILLKGIYGEQLEREAKRLCRKWSKQGFKEVRHER